MLIIINLILITFIICFILYLKNLIKIKPRIKKDKIDLFKEQVVSKQNLYNNLFNQTIILNDK